MANATLRIATRRSNLALWQANYVKQLVESRGLGIQCEIVALDTSGDLNRDRPIQTEGGKGLFLKELETELLADRADIAVHSMKDVPLDLPRGLTVQTIGERGSVQDVAIGKLPLHQLADDAVIGTSSNRRRALVAQLYGRSNVRAVRGNVETRLRKLDEGDCDVLILAAAGLERLGMADRIAWKLPTDAFVPAVGQGALAVEFALDREDLADLTSDLRDVTVDECVNAERSVARQIGADCAMAFGAYCENIDEEFRLTSIVLSESGDQAIKSVTTHRNASDAAEITGHRLVQQGAKELIQPI